MMELVVEQVEAGASTPPLRSGVYKLRRSQVVSITATTLLKIERLTPLPNDACGIIRGSKRLLGSHDERYALLKKLHLHRVAVATIRLVRLSHLHEAKHHSTS